MQLTPAPDLSSAAGDLLRDTLGRQPQVIGRAPGRVNLIGEHTDYNEGLCLPLALPQATWAAVAAREDDLVRVVSDRAGTWQGRAPDATGWAAYVAGTIWALRESGVDVPGLDVAVSSAVPVGAGLSSSAALECAVGSAVAGLVGGIAPERLVRAAMRAEQDAVGAPTGGMDQTVALHAKPGHALLLDFLTNRHQQVPWEPAGHVLLVIDTGVRHDLADGAYAERRRECAEAVRRLRVASLREARLDQLPSPMPVWARRARHVITENERVQVLAAGALTGAWSGIGRMMNASHASLRDDFEVSCPELDVAVEAAQSAGAVGARMTGAGFGGCAIALVRENELTWVGDAVDRAFTEHGWAAPTYLLAEASGAATWTVVG